MKHTVFYRVLSSFLVLVTAVAATGMLTVPASIEADLGDTVTLSCRLQTEGRWYVIAWTRLHDNGSDTLLVSLPSGQMVPDWNPDIPKALRMRTQPLITVQSGMVEFNLVLSPLVCGDGGRYRCRSVAKFGDPSAVSVLVMHQPPGTPKVTTSERHSWTMNTSLTVMCEAEAGLPPQEFLWYYKTPRMRNFQIVERQNEAVYYHESGCHVTSRRALHVTLTSASGGTIYRCALPGRVEEKELYDEFTVQLPPSAVSESRDTGVNYSSEADCDHPDCPIKVDKRLDASNGGQPQARSFLSTLAIGCCNSVIFTLIGSALAKQYFVIT